LGLDRKASAFIAGVLNVKLAYVHSCTRPEVRLTPGQRILCWDCCEKMCYV